MRNKALTERLKNSSCGPPASRTQQRFESVNEIEAILNHLPAFHSMSSVLEVVLHKRLFIDGILFFRTTH